MSKAKYTKKYWMNCPSCNKPRYIKIEPTLESIQCICGAILYEQDVPPMDVKDWDSIKNWNIWKAWFTAFELSDFEEKRIMKFAKAVEATALEEQRKKYMLAVELIPESFEVESNGEMIWIKKGVSEFKQEVVDILNERKL